MNGKIEYLKNEGALETLDKLIDLYKFCVLQDNDAEAKAVMGLILTIATHRLIYKGADNERY